jgi:hypothetical protein
VLSTFILAGFRLGDNFLDRIKQCVFARSVPVLDFIQNNGWLKSVGLCEDGFVSLFDYREQVKYLIEKYSDKTDAYVLQGLLSKLNYSAYLFTLKKRRIINPS